MVSTWAVFAGSKVNSYLRKYLLYWKTSSSTVNRYLFWEVSICLLSGVYFLYLFLSGTQDLFTFQTQAHISL